MEIDNLFEIGMANVKFTEYLRANMRYPKLANGSSRFYIVPLSIEISESGNLDLIVYSKAPGPIREKFKYTEAKEFVDTAISLVQSFEDWVPNKVDGKTQKTKREVQISFFYHKRLFEDEELILNPDTRPIFSNKEDRRYQYVVEGRFGCDGVGAILVVIDEAGNPQDIECLWGMGKTNCIVLENEFLSLGPWEPATLNGEKVKSHMVMPIYA